MAARTGRQTPTQSVVLPYSKTHGKEAIELYHKSGSKAMKWQQEQVNNILAFGRDGLWIHSHYGYEVSRRNGKSEVIIMLALYFLDAGARILYTAHRTDTSHAVWERLYDVVPEAGMVITGQYRAFGKEHIYVQDGGRIEFRTRTSKGGLGTGYDVLIIDEAQEYTTDQESALKYIVSAAENPLTVLCGTPPTMESAGTVFRKMRDDTFQGRRPNTGWAEWSVYRQTDPRDKEAWYETNPSLGHRLTERAIQDEITGDDLDFNIQRLGYWVTFNLKSAISAADWAAGLIKELPAFRTRPFFGIKYGHDGEHVALSFAAKTADGRIFVNAIDCRPTRAGTGWIIDQIRALKPEKVVVDGASGQQLLSEDMKAAKLKPPVFPKISEIILASSGFEQALFAAEICHTDQPSLTQAATNCEHRAIGSSGGYGYKALREDIEIALLDSVVLAHWAAKQAKEKKHKQKISY